MSGAGRIVHASCVALDGRGVLIEGPSGSGKSSLALWLMALGARLVADDRVRLTPGGAEGSVAEGAPGTGGAAEGGPAEGAPAEGGGAEGGAAGRPRAAAPEGLPALIEARGVGLLPAARLNAAPLWLVIDLGRAETARLPPIRHRTLFGYRLPLLHKSEGVHFPAALMQYVKGL